MPPGKAHHGTTPNPGPWSLHQGCRHPAAPIPMSPLSFSVTLLTCLLVPERSALVLQDTTAPRGLGHAPALPTWHL